MPVAIRTITGMIKKARRMAGKFQTHVNMMMPEGSVTPLNWLRWTQSVPTATSSGTRTSTPSRSTSPPFASVAV